jgi:hypothetical protein
VFLKHIYVYIKEYPRVILQYGVKTDIKKNIFILVWDSIFTRQSAEVLLNITMLFLQRQDNARQF